MTELSIILPALNESQSLASLLPRLRELQPEAEIIVVDDGSTDDTRAVCEAAGVKVVSHPHNLGNAAAVKNGARHASGRILAMMDADGQHRPEDLAGLLDALDQGFDMVVGCRDREGHASLGRRLANGLFNALASYVTGQTIRDLTSGMRVIRRERFEEFISLLPNAFSYETTLTLALCRSGYAVHFHPITVLQRVGESHIRPLTDGVRFLVIIFKITALYAPLKIFVPVAAALFTTALAYYGYTFATEARFSDISLLLFIASVVIFMIGLVSEQITMLLYKR